MGEPLQLFPEFTRRNHHRRITSRGSAGNELLQGTEMNLSPDTNHPQPFRCRVEVLQAPHTTKFSIETAERHSNRIDLRRFEIDITQ